MSAPILLTGATGQMGQALAASLPAEKTQIFSRQQLDLSQPQQLHTQLAAHKEAKIFLNPAAYTAVDDAEDHPAQAHAINADAVQTLARFAFTHGMIFVHFSTDYVFDGQKSGPYTEEDTPNPLSVYGTSKLAGEQAVMQEAAKHAGARWLIFRLSWVYDAVHHNFFTTMLRLGHEREHLSVVADQIGAPSYAPDLAAHSLQALKAAQAMERFPSGLYHLSHQGSTSWHGFAEAIFAGTHALGTALKVEEVKPISSDDWPTKATRPKNSRLNGATFQQMFNTALPSWETGLSRCINARLQLEAAHAH